MSVYQEMNKYYTDIVDDHFNEHYKREDRKEEVQEIIETLGFMFPQGNILELAGGGGFWTKRLHRHYNRVFSMDQNISELKKASILYPNIVPIRIDLLNKQHFENVVKGNTFSGVFASCWISHILREDLNEYLWHLKLSLQSTLNSDGSIVFIDSLLLPDGPALGYKDGNTYQQRTLKNGTPIQVVKNFYRIVDWVKFIEDKSIGKIVEYREWKHFYMLKFKVN